MAQVMIPLDRCRYSYKSTIGEDNMKFLTMLAFATALAFPAMAQQTQTDCTLYGNTANCTSNSTPTFQQSMDTFNKNMEDTANNLAAIKQARQANMDAKVRVEYCRQNPGGSVTTSGGQIRGCIDEIAYVRAACDVQKWKGVCGKDWAWIKTFKPPEVTAQSQNAASPKAECDSYVKVDGAESLSYDELVSRAQTLSKCVVFGTTDDSALASNLVYSASTRAYEAFALLPVVDYLKRHGEDGRFRSEDAQGKR
jgi:hypothetical protein